NVNLLVERTTCGGLCSVSKNQTHAVRAIIYRESFIERIDFYGRRTVRDAKFNGRISRSISLHVVRPNGDCGKSSREARACGLIVPHPNNGTVQRSKTHEPCIFEVTRGTCFTSCRMKKSVGAHGSSC